MLVGVLAALKSGRPYIMVPSYFPEQRVCQIVTSSEACAAFAMGETAFPAVDCHRYCRGELEALLARYAGAAVDPALCVGMDDMVLLFYTPAARHAQGGNDHPAQHRAFVPGGIRFAIWVCLPVC